MLEIALVALLLSCVLANAVVVFVVLMGRREDRLESSMPIGVPVVWCDGYDRHALCRRPGVPHYGHWIVKPK